MVELDKKYKKVVDGIAATISKSAELEAYLETEEYEQYKAIIEAYEPAIQELYEQVAAESPLQLLALEEELLREDLEGLYLHKVAGYSVLRGEVNDRVKYRRPQDHFKKVILAVANSSNFDMLKMRVGQAVKVGFSLSSDIWVTNIIESVSNKFVKTYLLSQKSDTLRVEQHRLSAFNKYRIQFKSLNFSTTEFPTTMSELRSEYYRLRSFIIHRGKGEFDNSSLLPHIHEFFTNKELIGSDEYLRIIILIGLFIDLDDKSKDAFAAAFASMSKDATDFTDEYFDILKELNDWNQVDITPAADKRLSNLINGKGTAEVNKYYELMTEIHTKGFVHEDAIEAVQKYYNQHEGLSVQNECLRSAIVNYVKQLMSNLPVESYQDYFELNKTFVQYIHIFSNQRFNQSVKDYSLKYIKKLMKQFTDKRGRDYQDIKKFVKTTFLDLGFMTDKQLVELFKTRRVKKS